MEKVRNEDFGVINVVGKELVDELFTLSVVCAYGKDSCRKSA